MNYIVFDLEWNQCPVGKEKENKRIPFEIIEIGAVKLDESLNLVDKFSMTIKPMVYKTLHFKIKEISKITLEELNNSNNFKVVVKDFLDWCGQDVIFCTWGSLDLLELQRNMQYHKIKTRLGFPLKYLDIQKLFSIDKEDGKLRRTLGFAVDYLNIPMDNNFHRALSDAVYTAKVMRSIEFDRVKCFYSIDCYYIPRNKEEEIYARFLTYSKYISRRFSSKENALLDKDVISLNCCKCNEEMEVVIPWFSDNAKVYHALGRCKEHGYMKCTLRMRKSATGQLYVVKVVKPTTQEGIEIMEEKQDAIREKRRERRQRLLDENKE